MHYRPEIDGLRAIAVLAVIFSHVGIDAFAGGFVGVDVFFVISGYLITSIILRDIEAGKFSLLHFYERRAKRILPALFFVLLCSFALFWTVLTPPDFRTFSKSLIAAAFSVSNLYFMKSIDYFSPAANEMPLLHTWSLGVEEQFYLLFPICFLFLRGKPKLAMLFGLLGLVSFVGCVVGSDLFPVATYYLLPTRAWEMLVGASLAITAVGSSKKLKPYLALLGMGLVLYAIFMLDGGVAYPSGYTVLPVLGTALILSYGDTQGPVGSILSNRAFVATGKISFSAYLWHQPIFVFGRLKGYDFESSSVRLTAIAVVVALATMTYLLIERPARYSRMPLKRLALTLGMILLVVTALGAWGTLSRGIPSRMPAAFHAFYSKLDFNRHCLTPALSVDFDLPVSGCVSGEDNNGLKVAIWGDSVAASLAPAISSVLAVKNAQIAQLTYNTCAPLPSVHLSAAPLSKFCDDVNNRALRFVVENKFDAVVLAGAWVGFFDAPRLTIGGTAMPRSASSLIQAKKRYSDLIAYLNQQNIRVFAIDPMVQVDFNSANRMAHWVIQGVLDKDISVSLDVFDNNVIQADLVLDAGGGDKYRRVKLREVFCDQIECFLARNGVPYLADKMHFTEAGAKLVAEKLRDELFAAGVLP